MPHSKKLLKINSQYVLHWHLKIGQFLGTLQTKDIPQKLGVKPVVLMRWLSGKCIVPHAALQRIKFYAIAPYRRPLTLLNAKHDACMLTDEDDIMSKYEWMSMIFDQMSMPTKRKFCHKLRKRGCKMPI